MPYLIDGHNLIGSMPDIHLADPDDEMQLVQQIVLYFGKTRKSGTIYFDRRGPGAARTTRFGRLKVEFTTPPNTADHAIQKRLKQLRGEARNYIVISSDRQVQQAAYEAGARVMESHDFVLLLQTKEAVRNGDEKPTPPITSNDVNYWEGVFRNSTKNGKKIL
jgi:predicted RNA-binding protein with PIN domain